MSSLSLGKLYKSLCGKQLLIPHICLLYNILSEWIQKVTAATLWMATHPDLFWKERYESS